MPRVYNRHHKDAPPEAVYIGRGSKWGNPYVIGRDGTREQVIELYREWLYRRYPTFGELREAIEELRCKDLVCYCAPLPCHGDILLEVANA